MKQRVLILGLVVILPLFFTGALLAMTSSWDFSVSVEPAVVDLSQGPREAAVTVTFTHTASVADNVLVHCSIQSGEALTVSNGVYVLGGNSVIWVGDVLTGTAAVFSFTARPAQWPDTMVPCTLIEAGQAQQIVTSTIGVVPYRAWLPMVLKNHGTPIEPAGVHTWTYPTENWLLQSAGSDLASAVAGSDLRAWRNDQRALTINESPRSPGKPYYLLRSLLTFDLRPLAAGTVISAWLELYRYNSWYGSFDLKFERGLWTRPPGPADWNAYGETLGVYDAGPWSASELSFTVPLTGLLGRPRPAELNLTLRGDETTVLPIGAWNSLHTDIALQWPDDWPPPQAPTGTPVSRLHLIIAPEASP